MITPYRRQKIKEIIKTAALTAFDKDYCVDELFDIYPKEVNSDKVWEDVNLVINQLFSNEKDKIIDSLFMILDNLSFQGTLLEDEEEEINRLYEAYCQIKTGEENV